jgi:hypothetical protein
MENILTISLVITLITIIFIAIGYLSTGIVVGWLVKDEPAIRSELLKEKNRMHVIGKGLITIDGGTFISSGCKNALSKWYIRGLGQIPRWSKSHKIIERIYNEGKITEKITLDKIFGN